jgi:hypothetical protein
MNSKRQERKLMGPAILIMLALPLIFGRPALAAQDP